MQQRYYFEPEGHNSYAFSEAQRPAAAKPKQTRRYNGPPKGSEEAKARMERVRAAQYAKNGLVYGGSNSDAREAGGSCATYRYG